MAKNKVIVRKSGFFGKLLALLLGIFIGIFVGLGGLVGIVYFALTGFKISEIFGYVEQATGDIPEEEYVGETYLDKTLLEAIMDASGIISGVASGGNTFGDLVEISPFVGTSISSLPDMLKEYGIKLTEEELLAMSVPDVAPFFQEQIGNIQIAPMLELLGQPVDANNVIMCAILYGEKDVHYTVVEVDGEKTVEMLPLTYTLTDGNFYDYEDTMYALNGEKWTNENSEYVIKTETAQSADESISYAYAIYELVNETEILRYRLALKEGETNVYEVYADDEKQRHSGATITSLASNDFMSTLENMPIGDLLSLDASSDPLMLALAYGEDGYEIDGETLTVTTATPTTLKELKESGSTLAQDLEIATALGLDENNAESIDKMMRAIAFGKAGEDYDVEDNKIVMKEGKSPKKIRDLNADLIKTLTISDVIDVNETDGDDKSPAILIALKDTAIGNLSTTIKTMPLKSIIPEAETNTILRHLANSTIDNLATDINNLSIQQVFCDDIYEKVYFADYGTATPTQVYLKEGKYYTDATYTTEYTGSASIIDLFIAKNSKTTSDAGECRYLYHDPADNAYHYYNVTTATESTETGKPVLTGVWYFLLTKDGEEQEDYKLTQTSHLVDNMTENVQKATLQELHDNDLLVFDDPSVLSRKLKGTTYTLGSLKITELITFLASDAFTDA